jgi:hypothetical protein
MTLAAVNRLVHRTVIFETNVESYRRRAVAEQGTDELLTLGVATDRIFATASVDDNKPNLS